jgi:hypothetical protein
MEGVQGRLQRGALDDQFKRLTTAPVIGGDRRHIYTICTCTPSGSLM